MKTCDGTYDNCKSVQSLDRINRQRLLVSVVVKTAACCLHCDGWKQYSAQTDCRTFDDSGQVTYANRYVIREWAHNTRDTA